MNLFTVCETEEDNFSPFHEKWTGLILHHACAGVTLTPLMRFFNAGCDVFFVTLLKKKKESGDEPSVFLSCPYYGSPAPVLAAHFRGKTIQIILTVVTIFISQRVTR